MFKICTEICFFIKVNFPHPPCLFTRGSTPIRPERLFTLNALPRTGSLSLTFICTKEVWALRWWPSELIPGKWQWIWPCRTWKSLTRAATVVCTGYTAKWETLPQEILRIATSSTSQSVSRNVSTRQKSKCNCWKSCWYVVSRLTFIFCLQWRFTLLRSGTTPLLKLDQAGSSGDIVSTSPASLNLSTREVPFSCGWSGPMGPSGTLCQHSLPRSLSPSPTPSLVMKATTVVYTKSRPESGHLSLEKASLYPSPYEVRRTVLKCALFPDRFSSKLKRPRNFV